MMLTLALALAVQAAPAPAPSPSNDDTIVITATRDSLRRALERCVAGDCTVREDVVASIRYAEVLFKAGDYLKARRTLQDAIARDKHGAADDPNAVAALYEATANVALHDGDQDVVRHAGAARVAVLRDNLPGADARLLLAALENGDQMATTGRIDAAESRYRAVAARAHRTDLGLVYASATMRIALLAHADHRDGDARRLLGGVLTDDRVPETSKLATRAMLARFARERGDRGATDALVARYMAQPASVRGETQILLWQPTLDQPWESNGLGPFNIVDRASQGGVLDHPGWVDIGFTIKDDGTVTGVEILRGTPGTGWTKPILKTIAGRRYTPAAPPGSEHYRIERWSLVLDYGVPKGSLIRRPAERPHFVKMELTPDVSASAKS